MKLVQNTKFHKKALYSNQNRGVANFFGYPLENLYDPLINNPQLSDLAQRGLRQGYRRLGDIVDAIGGRGELPSISTPYPAPLPDLHAPISYQIQETIKGIPEKIEQIKVKGFESIVQPAQGVARSIGEAVSNARNYFTDKNLLIAGTVGTAGLGGGALAYSRAIKGKTPIPVPPNPTHKLTQIGSLADRYEALRNQMKSIPTKYKVGGAAILGAAGLGGTALALNRSREDLDVDLETGNYNYFIQPELMVNFGFKPLTPNKLARVKHALAKSGNLVSSNPKLRKRALTALDNIKSLERMVTTRPTGRRTY